MPARRLALMVLLLALGGTGFAWYYGWLARAEPVTRYRLANADSGALLSTVSATGTVNPVVTVLVGSQLSGQIKELLADFNTPVTTNQIIARLDTDQIVARLREAEADGASARAALAQQRAGLARVRADANVARANLASARAQVARAEAQLKDAERDFQRRRELLARGAATAADAERAETALDSARAQLATARAQAEAATAQLAAAESGVAVGEAQVAGAEAQIAQREASVERVKVDLDHAEIRSPIDGVVIQRNVDIGQTVAASLQAPTLFTIAQDLRQIEVHASVDEGDIGRVTPGQEVSFTVNAYPTQFSGEVLQVRLGPQTVQNVVTYTVVIGADNADLRLLPGMTATVRIVTERRSQTLRVPNAALRYRPPGTAAGAPGDPGAPSATGDSLDEMATTLGNRLQLSAEQKSDLTQLIDDARREFRGLRALGLPPEEMRPKIQAIRRALDQRIAGLLRPEQHGEYEKWRSERGQRGVGGRQAAGGTPGRVFIVGADGLPKAVPLRLGITDGSMTEVLAGDLRAGQEVIVGGGPRSAPGTPPPGPRFGL